MKFGGKGCCRFFCQSAIASQWLINAFYRGSSESPRLPISNWSGLCVVFRHLTLGSTIASCTSARLSNGRL